MKSKFLLTLPIIIFISACAPPNNTNDFTGVNGPREATYVPQARNQPTERIQTPTAPQPAAPQSDSSAAPVLKGKPPDPSETTPSEPEFALESIPTPAPRKPVPQPARLAPALTTDARGMEETLLKLINAARIQRGLSPLKFSRAQSKGTSGCIGSAGHSEYMAQRGTISHDNFPRNVCLRSNASAENVAFAGGEESRALQTVHRSLMNSPGHYANLMNAQYNTVGLGFFYYKNRLYVTESFLRL